MKYLRYFFVLVGLFFVLNVNADFVYPIKTISKVDCRFQDFSTLGDECKMPLPILKTLDYEKYKNDYNLYRRVYTILWGSTYDYGWDVGNGGHGGVDIATAKGTPIYAITDGKVVLAKNIVGRGNTVKIEHIVNGRKVYSNYAHLSKIEGSYGDNIKTNTKIGEVGNTGNSYGNHLHFQIDLAVSGTGPRYRSNCSEKNYDKIVNSNVCFDQLNTNTIDPLLFLETSGVIIKATEIDKPKQEKISKQGLLSRQEILKKEIQDFLKIYDVKVSLLGLGGNIELGKSGTFRISVYDKRTKKPFTGSFPGNMNFKYDQNRFSLFPNGILQIDNGVRDFKITPKMSGKMTLEVYIGETFFKKVNFGVIDTKKSIIPKTGVILTSSKNVISSNNKSALYFKDNFGLNIFGFKFDGKYTLSSPDKSVKFCLKKANSLSNLQYIYNTNCEDKYFKDEITFDYNNTTLGLLIFEYKVLNLGVNIINISNGSKNIIQAKVFGVEPYDIDYKYAYYNDVLDIAKLGIASGINKGYFMQDRELSTQDGVNFLTSALEYKLSKCYNFDCKNIYLEKINLLSKYQNSKYTYFTRGEFLSLIGEYFPLENYNGKDEIKFRDLDSTKQIFSKNILKNKTWNDYFGQTKYFQPDKNITRGEGAFLINSILK
ncbi:MAG: M23 family metallopeptidase [Candidatus Gracilibacteria bacterium]|nr:M23 family metallopeptidase [Candidatus Gracilibacteria bacterium]